jgi:hypothetical protein
MVQEMPLVSVLVFMQDALPASADVMVEMMLSQVQDLG